MTQRRVGRAVIDLVYRELAGTDSWCALRDPGFQRSSRFIEPTAGRANRSAGRLLLNGSIIGLIDRRHGNRIDACTHGGFEPYKKRLAA